jgi:hypothetical protein
VIRGRSKNLLSEKNIHSLWKNYPLFHPFTADANLCIRGVEFSEGIGKNKMQTAAKGPKLHEKL